MGSPSKAQVESYSDAVAALIQANINGFAAEYSARTINTLWDLVDASGDPDVETYLGEAAQAVSVQSLPEKELLATRGW